LRYGRTGRFAILAYLITVLLLASCEKQSETTGETGRNKETGMRIETLVVGQIQTNCYVVWDEESKDAAVIDPGGDEKRIKAFIDKNGLKLKAILLTHGHWDHVSGCKGLKNLTDAPVYAHKDITGTGGCETAGELVEGEAFKAGSLQFDIIHTPGHEPGNVCLHIDNALFVGDLIFRGSVGRTDLAGGSLDQLLRSIAIRISELPDDTRVFSGHGPATKLGWERENNPYFQLAKERVGG